MTIRVLVRNVDDAGAGNEKSIKVTGQLYSRDDKGAITGAAVQDEVVLKPGDAQEFWAHSTRDLLIQEV